MKRFAVIVLTVTATAGIHLATRHPAHAGCGPTEGLMRICYKGACEIQKLIRECSSVGAGNHYESNRGYFFGYSNYIGGRASQMIVRYQQNQVLYKGDPDGSPYKFEVCGESRGIGRLCSETSWGR